MEGDRNGKKNVREKRAGSVCAGIGLYGILPCLGAPTEKDNPYDNERLVGEALAPYRDKVQIATKFGIRFDLSSHQVPTGIP